MKLFRICTCVLIALSVYSCTNDDDPQITDLPTLAFSWDNQTVELETDNGWCTTRFNNGLAISNSLLQTQYVLQWDGDSGAGIKQSPKMTIAVADDEHLTPSVSSLTIEIINGTHYLIKFIADGKLGSIVIPM